MSKHPYVGIFFAVHPGSTGDNVLMMETLEDAMKMHTGIETSISMVTTVTTIEIFIPNLDIDCVKYNVCTIVVGIPFYFFQNKCCMQKTTDASCK